MSVILESDIIDAYINNEIGEYDVIDLYMEGYISDNTMDLLIDEDDYISEAALDISYEMEALEEGRLSRIGRAIKHNIKQFGRGAAVGLNLQAGGLASLVGAKKFAQGRFDATREQFKKARHEHLDYLSKQKDDARKSGHMSAADSYDKKFKKAMAANKELVRRRIEARKNA